jgi:uncharacterized membrane protein
MVLMMIVKVVLAGRVATVKVNRIRLDVVLVEFVMGTVWLVELELSV